MPGPRAAPDPGTVLLGHALTYTRSALLDVHPDHLCLPTPCARWRLADLLAHMDDALDAFAEGANGAIGLHSAGPAPVEERIASLQSKACSLLGVWTAADSPVVEVGGRPMAVGTISRLAALEITVHGWDVGRSTGHGAPLPDDLAAELLPTALAVALEQTDEFGAPLPVPVDASAGRRLLALLGRRASYPG